MAEIAEQAVADIQRAAGNAAQRQAQGHARRGCFQPLAGLLQQLGRQLHAAQHGLQCQACIAQSAADPDLIAGPGAAAQQGLAGRDFAEHGDADIERAARGVAADEFAVMGIGQGQQAGRKFADPGFVGTGQGQGQRERQRPGTAGGQIAEVDGQSLVTQQARVHIGKEVAALDQHVAGDGQLHAGGRGQQRAVVAHAQGGATHGALEIAADQIEFTHEVSGRPRCCGLVGRWSAAVEGQGQKKLSGLRQKRWRMAL
jgi:hypothetical protein